MRRFGSGRVGFWTRHRRASYPCFCWMPTVTSPKIYGQSRSVSTAAKKKTHSTVSVWENSCGTTICKKRTHTSQWERLSLDPSLILRSTSRVFRLVFMFTDVVHCTTTEIDCNWQQLRGEGIIASLSASFSISLLTEHTKKGKITNGTRTSSHRGPFRVGPDPLSGTGRGSMPARRGVDPSDSHRFFGRNSTKCSWTPALTCTPKKLRPRSQLLRIHWMRDTT